MRILKIMDGRTIPKLVVIILAVVLVSLGIARLLNISNSTSQLRLANGTIVLEVADSPAERRQGLSGRDGLAEGQGMLFVFQKRGNHCIWMKDMRFAIDIIWLDNDHRVIHTEEQVSPDTYPRAFCPSGQASYVVEVRSGLINAADIAPGQKLQLRVNKPPR